ncbi:MAG: hypothetical protein Q9163_001754 [Psora crenata]
MVEFHAHPLPSLEVLAFGNLGWIYIIDEKTILKVPDTPADENFSKELDAYDIIERLDPCPNIAQSFLRVPEGIFMPRYEGGSLEQRLSAQQVRSKPGICGQVVQVIKHEPITLVERWISELSDAVAWLEALGYVHGDLAPRNLVLDRDDHLKLVDFEHLAEIGTVSDGNQCPYARVLGPEAGSQKGSYGVYSARTEQFAIGSIAYLVTRGYEPYENESFGPDHGPVVVERFQLRQFPALRDGNIDKIIRRCWWGEYVRVKELAQEAKLLIGARELPRATALDSRYCLARRNDCQRLVDQGLLRRG